MIHWSLNPEYAASAVATVFGDIDRVFALEGDLIAHDSLSFIQFFLCAYDDDSVTKTQFDIKI